MCVANCFAPHTSCSLRKITRLCDAQQCASSRVTFGILNMLVVVRNAPYLYVRIEGDPWIELVSYPDPDSHSCGWITSPLRGKRFESDWFPNILVTVDRSEYSSSPDPLST